MNELLLQKQANLLRLNTLNAVYQAQSGHLGGSYSAAEIITYLYFVEMNIRPDDPKWEDRDRFVLSKGHAAPILYSALAEKGFFQKKEQGTLRQLGSILQGHPDMNKTPGVDMSTGSLGQGLSAAVGMALAGKMNHKNYYVYALVGDGEMEEGEIWEAVMSAPKYQLDHLIVFLDYNRLQLDGSLEEIMSVDPIAEKLQAFNWNVLEINGHNFSDLYEAVQKAKQTVDIPTFIVAHTIKGKGISFMENQAAWHGKAPGLIEYQNSLRELGAML